MQDFKAIKYLKTGNKRQRSAYRELKSIGIFEQLQQYTPVLTGTIPIGIDLPESDLDISCWVNDHAEFSLLLTELYSGKNGFELKTNVRETITTTIARFNTENFLVEIFGQNIPVEAQNAYRHMIVEYQILQNKGAQFKKEIIALKKQGLKTEPAFAKLLGLKGNPYEELLDFKL